MIFGFSFIGLFFNFLWLAILATGSILLLAAATGTHAKDWIDPKRWKSVLIYILKYSLMKLGDVPGELEAHEIEQYMFRTLACKKCVPAKCVSGCGCVGMARMNVRGDVCSLGRWGEFKSKEEWEDYKKEYNVEFNLTIQNTNIDNIETDGYNSTGDV